MSQNDELFDENLRAKSALSLPKTQKRKKLEKILKQQKTLTLIQYSVSTFIFFIGFCLYKFSSISLSIGSLSVKDVTFQKIDINIGSCLIFISLYMIVKITLNLNIKMED